MHWYNSSRSNSTNSSFFMGFVGLSMQIYFCIWTAADYTIFQFHCRGLSLLRSSSWLVLSFPWYDSRVCICMLMFEYDYRSKSVSVLIESCFKWFAFTKKLLLFWFGECVCLQCKQSNKSMQDNFMHATHSTTAIIKCAFSHFLALCFSLTVFCSPSVSAIVNTNNQQPTHRMNLFLCNSF